MCHEILVTSLSFPNLHSYVDNQLRKSKRFDAAGIQRDYPEFFLPTPRRRSSGGAQGFPGFTDLNGNSAMKNVDEGQLRYWTSDMCTNNAHLFDFVVTVSLKYTLDHKMILSSIESYPR